MSHIPYRIFFIIVCQRAPSRDAGRRVRAAVSGTVKGLVRRLFDWCCQEWVMSVFRVPGQLPLFSFPHLESVVIESPVEFHYQPFGIDSDVVRFHLVNDGRQIRDGRIVIV